MGLLLLPLLLVLADPPESVGMVLKVKGEVTLTRAGGKPVRVWTMDLLRPGDRLGVPEGSEVTLFVIGDGHQEVLAAGKTATVQAKGCTPAEAIAGKPATKLGKDDLKDLGDDIRGGRFGGVKLRNGPDGKPLPVLNPLPGANILTGRPTLAWPPVENVDYYVVQIYNGQDNKDLLRLWRVETKENRLPFPDKPALGPVLHRWSVMARLKNGDDKVVVTVRQATFSVATARDIKALVAARPLAASDDPAELLLAAGLYDSRGALDEVLKVFERLARLLPGDANIQDNLAGLYDLGGRQDRAKSARDRAKHLRQTGGN